jgi:hypothetical protein
VLASLVLASLVLASLVLASLVLASLVLASLVLASLAALTMWVCPTETADAPSSSVRMARAKLKCCTASLGSWLSRNRSPRLKWLSAVHRFLAPRCLIRITRARPEYSRASLSLRWVVKNAARVLKQSEVARDSGPGVGGEELAKELAKRLVDRGGGKGIG